jgi:hypothetical protein
MEIVFFKEAEKDLDNFTLDFKKQVYSHLIKISQEELSRKHLHYGLPYFVEKIGYFGRIVYDIQENRIIVVRIFNDHKNYDRWCGK